MITIIRGNGKLLLKKDLIIFNKNSKLVLKENGITVLNQFNKGNSSVPGDGTDPEEPELVLTWLMLDSVWKDTKNWVDTEYWNDLPTTRNVINRNNSFGGYTFFNDDFKNSTHFSVEADVFMNGNTFNSELLLFKYNSNTYIRLDSGYISIQAFGGNYKRILDTSYGDIYRENGWNNLKVEIKYIAGDGVYYKVYLNKELVFNEKVGTSYKISNYYYCFFGKGYFGGVGYPFLGYVANLKLEDIKNNKKYTFLLNEETLQTSYKSLEDETIVLTCDNQGSGEVLTLDNHNYVKERLQVVEENTRNFINLTTATDFNLLSSLFNPKRAYEIEFDLYLNNTNTLNTGSIFSKDLTSSVKEIDLKLDAQSISLIVRGSSKVYMYSVRETKINGWTSFKLCVEYISTTLSEVKLYCDNVLVYTNFITNPSANAITNVSAYRFNGNLTLNNGGLLISNLKFTDLDKQSESKSYRLDDFIINNKNIPSDKFDRLESIYTTGNISFIEKYNHKYNNLLKTISNNTIRRFFKKNSENGLMLTSGNFDFNSVNNFKVELDFTLSDAITKQKIFSQSRSDTVTLITNELSIDSNKLYLIGKGIRYELATLIDLLNFNGTVFNNIKCEFDYISTTLFNFKITINGVETNYVNLSHNNYNNVYSLGGSAGYYSCKTEFFIGSGNVFTNNLVGKIANLKLTNLVNNDVLTFRMDEDNYEYRANEDINKSVFAFGTPDSEILDNPFV